MISKKVSNLFIYDMHVYTISNRILTVLSINLTPIYNSDWKYTYININSKRIK